MNSRPFKEFSNQLVAKIEEISVRAISKPKTRDKFDGKVKTMLYNLNNHLENHNGELADIVAQKDNQNGNGWVKDLGEIRTSYGQIYSLNQELMDTEKAIHRMERKAHVRALIFRFLTTLFIGAGVMIVYLVAQKLGVTMPLLRIAA